MNKTAVECLKLFRVCLFSGVQLFRACKIWLATQDHHCLIDKNDSLGETKMLMLAIKREIFITPPSTKLQNVKQ